MIYRILWFVAGMAATVLPFFFGLQYLYSGAVAPPDELRDVCGYYKEHYDDYECNCMRGSQGA